MSLAVIESRASVGTHAPQVLVEVHLTRGLPSFSIVGLPEKAVKESKDRVRGAILNSHLEFPRQRITVNLAPADLPKEGGRYDLPIALGILAASNQIPVIQLDHYVFLGELALSGELREITSGLIAALSLRNTEKTLVLPTASAQHAAIVPGVNVGHADHLLSLVEALNQNRAPEHVLCTDQVLSTTYPDIHHIVGHEFAKKAMEISASGLHSMIMVGPPGSGKTLLASSLPGILPPMNTSEALETAAIQSIGSLGFQLENWKIRPFRNPHHSASGASLVGGGTVPKPGEISQSHNGVLFLDELPEFNRNVLELLREPLESGEIHISRVQGQIRFDAKFLLIAACNPCPCGYNGDTSNRCVCTPDQVARYRSKLSGPLLDRIDLHVEVPVVPISQLREGVNPDTETTEDIKKRVIEARSIQQSRQDKLNGELTSHEISEFCPLDETTHDLLQNAVIKFGFSARAYHRIQKVARTIADVKGKENITIDDIAMAIKLRVLDRAIEY